MASAAAGQMVAALLQWPQATFASQVELGADKKARVTREVCSLDSGRPLYWQFLDAEAAAHCRLMAAFRHSL